MMKPHIKKINGFWYCDDNPRDWGLPKMMMLGLISPLPSDTPQLAYYEYCLVKNKPHQGGIFDLPSGKIALRRPIPIYNHVWSGQWKGA